MKPTVTNLKKLEELFHQLSYTVRYERGNFQSGYCIVEDRKIAVINKFFDTEARINTLLEILSTMEVDTSKLSEQGLAIYQMLAESITVSYREDA